MALGWSVDNCRESETNPQVPLLLNTFGAPPSGDGVLSAVCLSFVTS